MKEYHVELGKQNLGDFRAAGFPIDKVFEESEKELAKRERYYLPVEPKPGSWYGHKFNEVASRDLIRNFAYAIDDVNPLWSDKEYAQKTRHLGIIAPPTFLDCIARSYELALPGCPYITGYDAGTRWERFREVHEGDSFVVYDEWKGIEVKGNRASEAGPVLITHTLTTYLNQRDELMARCDGRHIILTSLSPNKSESAVHPPILPSEEYVYSDEELEAIKRGYEEGERHRRGASIHYWEDVVEGEELYPVVKGPLSVADMGAWFAVHPAFVTSHGWWLWKERAFYPPGLAGFVTHPISRIPLSAYAVHLEPTAAMLVTGTPRPFGQAAQMESWFGHLVTNWMGDDGFIRVLDSRAHRPNYFGDTTWVHGLVTGKYVEGGEHLADIDIWTTQQANLGVPPEDTGLAESAVAKLKAEGVRVTAHSKATVRLLARDS